MSAQQHSASLEIIQNNPNPIEISQNSFQVRSDPSNHLFEPEKIDDTFELSLDEHSLSFQIEQLKEQSTCKKVLKEGSINSQVQVINIKPHLIQKEEAKNIPLLQEQRKRKRKEIFQKYKQKTTENALVDSEIQSNPNALINTIDEILQIKSPQKTEKKQTKPSTRFLQKQFQEKASNIESTKFRKKDSGFVVATSFSENIETIDLKSKQTNINPPLVQKIQSTASVTQFHIPSEINELHRIDSTSKVVICSTNSFLMESEVNRISIIEAQEEQVSRDSADIQNFLQSQIFRDDLLQKTIQKDDTSYKNIQISMVNPSIMLTMVQSPMNKLYNERRLGLTREKSQATLHAMSIEQGQKLLRKNLSERKIKIFESIHLKPELIVKQKPLSYEEQRIPLYLRQIRMKNTIYPNFYLKQKNKDFYQQQNIAFRELLREFKKALSFLDFVNEVAYERYMILISLEKKLLNSLTLETFMSCGWQKLSKIKELPILRPYENFNKRKYDYEKVKGALNNYLYIGQYYEKFDLNLQDPKAQKKYFEIRSKFWAIEKNIKMIGEDIYLLASTQIFPAHYLEFFKALKGDFPRFSKPFQQLQYTRNLLAKYYALCQSGDLLSISQIGRYLKQRLQKMVQRTVMV